MQLLGPTSGEVKRLRKLLSSKRAREESRTCVLEGQHLVHDALANSAAIDTIYVEQGQHFDWLNDVASTAQVKFVEPGVMERIADAQTPQPICATLPFVDVSLNEIEQASRVVVLCEVSDPGNAGTIIRTAEASGVEAVVLTKGSVDLYNPKTLRAAAAATFLVPIVRDVEIDDVLLANDKASRDNLATVVSGGQSVFKCDLSNKWAFWMGNEANGLSDDIVEQCSIKLSVPQAGRSESLNVAIASAIVMFEALRQRIDTARA